MLKLFQVTLFGSNLPEVDGPWQYVNELEQADLVVFWGGEDVNPRLYNEKPCRYVHPETGNNRDARESIMYRWATEKGIPILGICRGSQFVTVMNGGKLYQHVDNHGISGTHPVTDIFGQTYEATSTHHQMMRPKGNFQLVAWAKEAEMYLDQHNKWHDFGSNFRDIETVYYPDTKTLAVQGHPEYLYGDHPFRLAVSKYMKHFLFPAK